jgi:hypothetical protein
VGSVTWDWTFLHSPLSFTVLPLRYSDIHLPPTLRNLVSPRVTKYPPHPLHPKQMKESSSICHPNRWIFCHQFFGTFAKLRKATISFPMNARLSVYPSVRPSVRMEKHGSDWTYFREKLYISFFSKMFRKNSNLLKISQKWVFHVKTNILFFKSYLAQFFLEWETFQTKVAEKVKSLMDFSVTFFNRAVYEKMWTDMV